MMLGGTDACYVSPYAGLYLGSILGEGASLLKEQPPPPLYTLIHTLAEGTAL